MLSQSDIPDGFFLCQPSSLENNSRTRARGDCKIREAAPASTVERLKKQIKEGKRTYLILVVKSISLMTGTFRYFATAGGLMSYSIDIVEQNRQAASYVDRILRGANPAELPVQAPTKYETVLNLNTAKMLGFDVPPTLLVRADEVIE